MDLLTEIKPFLFKMLNEVNVYPREDQIKITDRGNPHKCTFVDGKMYVYTYRYNGEYLKNENKNSSIVLFKRK